MSVFNPRNRLVNFRLSEGEFDLLKAACKKSGARSLSDFARTQVLKGLEQGNGQADSVQNLTIRVKVLEDEVFPDRGKPLSRIPVQSEEETAEGGAPA